MPQAIDRVRIETLAGGEFIGRRQNLVWVGQSGVGKSHLIQAIGRCACVLGYRVRYETSASILQALTAALADHTLPRLLRYYAKFDLVILDEFGFDRVERLESPQAASLLYKLINVRDERSTALVTNVDFEKWGEYLGDPPLAMAFLDRIVDGAAILKINGKSYRAHRAERASDRQDAQEVKRGESRSRAAIADSGSAVLHHSSDITSPKHPTVAPPGNDAGGSIWPR